MNDSWYCQLFYLLTVGSASRSSQSSFHEHQILPIACRIDGRSMVKALTMSPGLQAPDASRSSLMMGASQQPPSTPTSARAGDSSASAAFASPLQIPEGGMRSQDLACKLAALELSAAQSGPQSPSHRVFVWRRRCAYVV